ncbi:hypothetical protein HN011_001098 [Eciton burchellii]|nr:hypothetical protein HN011_001098 [Eciton burchellii]
MRRLTNEQRDNIVANETQDNTLLNCGHPICKSCAIFKFANACPFCVEPIDDNSVDNKEHLLPLNVCLSRSIELLKTLDLLYFWKTRYASLSSRQLRQMWEQSRSSHIKGTCYECGQMFSIKCSKCAAFYCSFCYLKIHGEVLQNHTQTLYNADLANFANIFSCSSKCFKALSYYCNKCRLASCSSCTFRWHELHDIVLLAEKNRSILSEFDQVYENIKETSLQVARENELFYRTVSNDLRSIASKVLLTSRHASGTIRACSLNIKTAGLKYNIVIPVIPSCVPIGKHDDYSWTNGKARPIPLFYSENINYIVNA